MTQQTTKGEYEGIEIELTTKGPEAQDGHEIGSDVLHMKLTNAIEVTLRGEE